MKLKVSLGIGLPDTDYREDVKYFDCMSEMIDYVKDIVKKYFTLDEAPYYLYEIDDIRCFTVDISIDDYSDGYIYDYTFSEIIEGVDFWREISEELTLLKKNIDALLQ